MKILYVEDSATDADLTRLELKKTAPHFRLDCVSTQREALSVLEKKCDYDLVLSDMRLPDGDGLAILTHIRGRGLPLAVVIITGHGDEQTAVAVLKAGAQDYVVKREGYLAHLPHILEMARQCHLDQSLRCTQPLLVLYGEHNEADVDLTRRHMLQHAPHIRLEAVNRDSEILQRLSAPDHPYQAVLLDYRLPGTNALEILKELRQEIKSDLPIVLITGQGDEEVAVQALKLGAEDYVVKSQGCLHKLPSVLENAFFHTRMLSDHTRLQESEEKLRRTLENLRQAMEGTVELLAQTVETRDPYTAGHQRRVSRLALAIAGQMGLAADRLEGIRMAGLVHDVGKVGVPAEILSKPGKISSIERELIQGHAEKGYELLKTIEFPWPLDRIVRQHHERLDGAGYPQGLKGEQILLEARILAVADVVEAMSSHRPYRPELGIEKALEEIERNRGTLYDPEAVDACLQIFREGFSL